MSKNVLKEETLKNYDFIDAVSENIVTNGDMIKEIPLSEINSDSKNNIRETYEDIDELAMSIKEKGLLQSITVYRDGELYVPLYGFRRLRAFQLLAEENTEYRKIPCVVKRKEDVDFENIRVIQIIENLHRNSLRPMELKTALDVLREKGLSHREIAQKIGKKEDYIKNIYSKLSAVSENKEIEGIVKSNVNITLSDINEVSSLSPKKQAELLKEKSKGDIKTQKQLRAAVQNVKRISPLKKHTTKNNDNHATFKADFFRIHEKKLDIYAFHFDKSKADKKQKLQMIKAVSQILSFLKK